MSVLSGDLLEEDALRNIARKPMVDLRPLDGCEEILRRNQSYSPWKRETSMNTLTTSLSIVVKTLKLFTELCAGPVKAFSRVPSLSQNLLG